MNPAANQVSRSCMECIIEESIVKENNHWEPVMPSALLHTTALVWLMLLAATYNATPAILGCNIQKASDPKDIAKAPLAAIAGC